MQVKWTRCITSHVPSSTKFFQHVTPSKKSFTAARIAAPRLSNIWNSLAFDATLRRLPKRLSSKHLCCTREESGDSDRSEEFRGPDEPHPVEILADKVPVTAAEVDAPSIVASLEELVLSKDGIVERLGELLKEDSNISAEIATDLVAKLDGNGRASLLTALFASASATSDEHFSAADVNKDGVLDPQEFSNFVEMQAAKYGLLATPLTSKQIWLLGSRAAIGMLGFGFTDNFIMIIAGDAIQNSIGTSLALSPLMSAGLGNAVADLVGTAFREYIEGLSKKMMPDSRVSPLQMDMPEAWWAETVGASVGVTAGCLLGLVPLLVLNEAGSGGARPPLAAVAFRISGGRGMDGGEGGGGVVLGRWSGNEVWDGRVEEGGVVEEGRWVSRVEEGVLGPRGENYLIASVRAPEVVPPPLERQGGERYVAFILFLAVTLGIRRVWQFVHRKK